MTLTQNIAPQWKEEFLSFLRGDPVSEGFLAYCESDLNCQKALDEAVEQLFSSISSLVEMTEHAPNVPLSKT
ncbi:hypothetical protein VT84_03275 [Gemmata sp. SH-PL17]|uniref:hypothetical protein n=1 Tax=Gemmata sp. SH-PL17 TaxID=1630693 RepID=UPI00078EB9B2|nr:hypothetical protein [Gemmata sp. SH-PL17]AMV23404.1 hypothetical protein VT84_03275 [Gemmata sp. SH-PL17]